MKMIGKMWVKNRELIKKLEAENARLKETILNMAKQIRWCENHILEIRSNKKKEWTIDPSKTRKYN